MQHVCWTEEDLSEVSCLRGSGPETFEGLFLLISLNLPFGW